MIGDPGEQFLPWLGLNAKQAYTKFLRLRLGRLHSFHSISSFRAAQFTTSCLAPHQRNRATRRRPLMKGPLDSLE